MTLCLGTVCGLVLMAVGAALAAAPQAGIDRSFGTNGVVDLAANGAPAGGPEGTVAWAASADGASFVLRSIWTCTGTGSNSCVRTLSLQRYGANGAFDQSFGGSGTAVVAQGSSGWNEPDLAVDAEGRPIVAWANPQATFASRYTAAGAVDGSFGSGGQVRFDCDCGRGSSGVTVLPGGKLLLRQQVGPEPAQTLSLRRLLPTGALDSGFGENGLGSLAVDSSASTIFAARPNGSVVFTGPGNCCSSPREEPYVGRISVAGKQDLAFERATRKSLLAVPGTAYGQFASVNGLIPRPDGQLNVLGSVGRGGFVLRLKANGRPQRSFADKGARTLSRTVSTAVGDVAGGIFAVGTHPQASAPIAFRLFSDGRSDRRFKNFPLTKDYFPVYGETDLAAITGLRVLVYQDGYAFCRSACEQQPRVAMFQEPRPGKRP